MAWVVLLRGVNVGRKTFRPSQVVRELPELDLVSIGAAGTFVVRGPATPAQIRERIRSKLPFEAEIMIVPGRAIQELVLSDPLRADRRAPGVRGFLAVAARPWPSPVTVPIFAPSESRWEVEVRSVAGPLAWGVRRRLGPKLIYPTEVLERSFGLACTTRWWETVEEVARAMTPDTNVAGGFGRDPGTPPEGTRPRRHPDGRVGSKRPSQPRVKRT
jgi:uncharacterized protein (DUF1697 family)